MCPLLLALPAELRVKIDEYVLLSEASDLRLLRVCHQINMEARPTLYQRPLSFTSQTDLFAWIGRSRSTNLKRVRDLTLRLTDVDLSPVLSPDHRQTRMSVWALYQSELERMDHALASLPNLAALTITPPGPSHSQLLRGMYFSILALIPQRHPKLHSLVIEDTIELLEKVPTLHQLASIQCTVPVRPLQHNRAQAEAASYAVNATERNVHGMQDLAEKSSMVPGGIQRLRLAWNAERRRVVESATKDNIKGNTRVRKRVGRLRRTRSGGH